MDALTTLAALTPLLAVFGLLVVLRLPAMLAMPLGLVLTALAAAWIWKMPWVRIAAAGVEGLFAAASILCIVFGAILLLKTMALGGGIDAIRSSLAGISPDRRVQAIVVAWLFGAFIEGAAGFGTPAALAAPLMVAVGFPLLPAVVLALVADSAPVSFGAVGTPIVIGMGQGLQPGGEAAPVVREALAGVPMEDFLQQVTVQTVLMDLFVGTLVPLILCVLLTGGFGKRRSWREGLGLWKFALFAGLAYEVPALLAAYFLGPEFPALVGGLVGLGVVVPAARRRFLLPAEAWDDFAEGLPRGEGSDPAAATSAGAGRIGTLRAWLPYLLVAVLLVLTRVEALPFKRWLQNVRIAWADIFGTGISADIAPLYLPGAVFVVVVLLVPLLHRFRAAELERAFRETFGALLPSAAALGAAVPMVRIFTNSDVNGSGLQSMPIELADMAAAALGQWWPLAAPLIGALGSFVSGSATFSNMMFSLFQFSAAAQAGIDLDVVLAAQVLGACAGNMICVLNVVAAASVVSLAGKEGTVIRHTLPPMLFLVAATGALAMLWTRFG